MRHGPAWPSQSLRLSVSVSVCLSLLLSVCLPACLSVCAVGGRQTTVLAKAVSTSVGLSVCAVGRRQKHDPSQGSLYFCLSVCLSLLLSVCLCCRQKAKNGPRRSLLLSVSASVSLYFCLSVLYAEGKNTALAKPVPTSVCVSVL